MTVFLGAAARPSFVSLVTAIVVTVALVVLTTMVGLARPEGRILLVVTAAATGVPALVGAFDLVLALAVLPVVVAAVLVSTNRDAGGWFDVTPAGTVAPRGQLCACSRSSPGSPAC